MMTAYQTGTDIIDWDALTDLYAETGLVARYGRKRDRSKIREAFLNSDKVVTAWEDDGLVGAGRLLTDGICYGTVFDLAVRQPLRGRGIGRGLMNALLKGHEHLCIHLTSTFGNEAFYGKLGFKKHKTAYAKYPFASEYLVD